MPFFIDKYYILLIVPAALIALWAQIKVKTAYGEYSGKYLQSRITGQTAARLILDLNNLQDVRIEMIAGEMTDHYDPRDRVLRLSEGVYNRCSVAAVGIAAHEAGHAVQHAKGYAPLVIRNAIVPVCKIGSGLAMPLIIIGLLFSYQPIIGLGIILFSLATVFQLITLPVEFNASSYAKRVLAEQGFVTNEEAYGVNKMLTAAALTYVAALISSLASLLRLILLFGKRRD